MAEYPAWYENKHLDEVLFCEEFLEDHPMICINGTFFTADGRVSDENRLKKEIYDILKPWLATGLAKRVTSLLDILRMECYCPGLPLYQDRINVANGTLFLDGTFTENKEYCRNRLPIAYNPNAQQPVVWLHFLSQLLEPEDIPTLQEFHWVLPHPLHQGAKDAYPYW